MYKKGPTIGWPRELDHPRVTLVDVILSATQLMFVNIFILVLKSFSIWLNAGIDFLEFRPSEIAAAVTISVSVDIPKAVSSLIHVEKVNMLSPPKKKKTLIGISLVWVIIYKLTKFTRLSYIHKLFLSYVVFQVQKFCYLDASMSKKSFVNFVPLCSIFVFVLAFAL